MFALDTNVVSEMTRPFPDAQVMKWLKVTPRSALYLPSVVVAELFAGIRMLPDGRRKDGLEGFLSAFIVDTPSQNLLTFGFEEAVFYAAIVAQRRRQGREIKILDAQIAAMAAVRRMPVATRNMRDFEDCGIEIINPWAFVQ